MRKKTRGRKPKRSKYYRTLRNVGDGVRLHVNGQRVDIELSSLRRGRRVEPRLLVEASRVVDIRAVNG